MIATGAETNALGTYAGEYQVTGVVGRGGMGTVYAGIHPVIGTEVAIKVIDPRLGGDVGLVARFLQEARAVNKIRHPSIIEVFAFGESPELGHYLVMPLLHGRTLRERLEQGGPMSVGAALPILRQIAGALDAAHEAGVLHRDLKPDNVFLIDDRGGADRVKVLDFGIAKLTDGDGVTTTKIGQQMGTPLFMPPEQWEGVAIDHRGDLYALGVVLHYMVTGRYPFEASSPVALMNLHLNTAPTPASTHGAPMAVDRVVARALEKAPDGRFQSGAALCEALAATLDVGMAATMTPVPVAIAASAAPPRRSPRATLVIAGVVIAAVGVAAIWYARGSTGAGGAAAGALDAGAVVAPMAEAPAQVVVDAGPPSDASATPSAPPAAAPVEARARRKRPPAKTDDKAAPPPGEPEPKKEKTWGTTEKVFDD